MGRIRSGVIVIRLRRATANARLERIVADSHATALAAAPATRLLTDNAVAGYARRGWVVVEPPAGSPPLHLDPDPRLALGPAASRVCAVDDRRGTGLLPHVRYDFNDGGVLAIAAFGLLIVADSAAARVAAACRAHLERWAQVVVRGAENLRLGVATALARFGISDENPTLRTAAEATMACERADAAAQTSAQQAVASFAEDLERWDIVQDRIRVGYPDPTAHGLRERLEAAAKALRADPRACVIVEADEDLAASHHWWLLPRTARAAAALRKRRQGPLPLAAGMPHVARPEKTVPTRSREP